MNTDATIKSLIRETLHDQVMIEIDKVNETIEGCFIWAPLDDEFEVAYATGQRDLSWSLLTTLGGEQLCNQIEKTAVALAKEIRDSHPDWMDPGTYEGVGDPFEQFEEARGDIVTALVNSLALEG